MDGIAARSMSVDAFLAWEARQDQRYEFDGVRPVAMTGGTKAHNIIAGNVFSRLLERLRGSACRPFIADMKVRSGNRIRYPEVLVSCGSQILSDTVEAEPVVLFEVLSPSTAGIDRIVKLAEYRALPSLRRYVMLEQARMAATVIAASSAADGGRVWLHDLVTGPDSVLLLPEIGVQLRLGELYEGVALPAEDSPDAVPDMD